MQQQCSVCSAADKPLSRRSGALYCSDCAPSHFSNNSKERHTVAEPEVVATIRLYSSQAGGRAEAVHPPFFGCPVKVEGDDETLHECRIFLEKAGTVKPGDTFRAPVAFLRTDRVSPFLKLGTKFKLFEKTFIGEGEVVQIFPRRVLQKIDEAMRRFPDTPNP